MGETGSAPGRARNEAMRRLLCLALCALLPALAGQLPLPGAALAQDAATRAPQAPKDAAKDIAKDTKDAKAKAKKAKAGKKTGRNQAEKFQGETPTLTREELAKPYSGNTLYGPPAPPKSDADNATVPEYDPTPKTRPFAKQEPESPINFRLGGGQVIDPLTKKEVNPKADPTGKDSAKGMDLKGAVDKVGGKAEIQVDILKF